MSETTNKDVKPQTVLWVTAKCSDMFSMQMLPGLNSEPVAEYDGYVPLWFPNPNEEHYGDYVHLEIDIATGQILNWKRPTLGQLNKTFGKQIPSRRGNGEPDYASVGTSGLWPVKK